jgi:Zn-dependent peptidase ImmA (M78 family)
MDPDKIKSKKLTKPAIWDAVEDFRERVIGNFDLPVNVELAAESIGIPIIPTEDLSSDLGMDGFISNDLKYIYIDEDLYSDEENRYESRIRFTIAHELGHHQLHYDQIFNLNFNSVEEWIEFRIGMKSEKVSWFEYQAYEFAGRLLVPLDHLVDSTMKARKDVLKGSSWNDKPLSKEELITLVAPKICEKFKVSTGVIERRLEYDQALLLLGI